MPRITITLPDDQLHQWMTAAAARDLSLSAYVRLLREQDEDDTATSIEQRLSRLEQLAGLN